MNQFFISAFYFVIVIGFMVLIHEFGHYAVAKLLGVRVEQFAIGFGKRLFGFRRGETDYRINALPFGGYVKMSGENPMDQHSDDPREFLNHPRWHRFLIAIAGPVMNILLAVVLLTAVYMVHYEHASYMDQPAVVGWVEHGSPAEKQGIKPGDRIVQIDGVKDPTWEQVEIKQLLSANQPLNFAIQRGDQKIEGSVVPVAVTSSGAGSAGWSPDEPVIIGDLEPGMPAARAGLKPQDKIVSVDGQPVPSIQAMIESLQQTKNKPLQLEVQRAGNTLNLTVVPVLADTPGANEKHYRLGFRNSYQTTVTKLSLPEAFSHSLADNKRLFSDFASVGGKTGSAQSLSEDGLWTDRHCPTNWRCRPRKGLDAPSGLVRRHQPEPGHLQPAANPDHGWRGDPAAIYREPDGPRHQHDHKGANLSGSLCIPDLVRCHGDLQRHRQDDRTAAAVSHLSC